MAPPLLILRDIHLTFGGTPLLEGAELSLSERDRLCLVGRNGSGKSTLLKIAAGMVEPDAGEVFVQPGTTLRYLPQEPDLDGFATTLEFVEDGLAPGDDPHRAHYLLDQLGLDGSEDTSTLSGGEARRAALAQVLAPKPDILLLDEPTNHLDLPAIEWLERELAEIRSAMVLISHDRRFLQNLSQSTIWLDRGVTQRQNREFNAFESWRDQTLEQQELDRHKLDRKLVAEAAWLHRGVTARRKRNQGRLRALYALRAERKEMRRATGNISMAQTEAIQAGKLTIEAKAISKSWDGPPVVKNFSTRIQRGDRTGIIGPNGAGKTTLLNMLTGAEPPDDGSVRLGANIELVTLDQRREALDPDETLVDALTSGGEMVSVGGKSRHVVGYMKDFLFSPEQARTPVGVLSGGERGRLMLARALARPSNLLVLDEPTNDLDLETLDLLQEMLVDYPGNVLLVSHDRDFLDRVVTSVIASEGDGKWIEYAGGYTDMVAQRDEVVLPEITETVRKPKFAKPSNHTSQSRKLTFKDKHALETLPARMAELQ
ncbi:MAG: ABC-F family ATP-binding cassette domain-containing protein, partial [Pseudomonadota bacterium]|nr:ABC-F family ATP-binding cassette domain-containing protein [Pseudomonadota bacterium]